MSPTPRPPTLDAVAVRSELEALWEREVVPRLVEYVRLPAKSPSFDARWEAHGFLDQALRMGEAWARSRPIEGLRAEIVKLPGRTPVLLVEVPGASDDPVLLYGHMDKQPEMVGWAEGLGPWTPVRRGDRLFGRGAGDDGYAVFAALSAIETLQARGVPHARCVVLIETAEESGSPDLPAYMDALAGRLGRPGLVVCLDSSCGSYDRLWGATSLRGLVNGILSVEVLEEGVHSGASGIVPSSFRILRRLLARLEDELTGEILPPELSAAVPADRRAQVAQVAALLGDELWTRYPLVPGMRAVEGSPADLLLASTWRPALAVTGAAGLPALEDAGNVLRPRTAVKLSLRLPPTTDPAAAVRRLQALFQTDPPYGARVRFDAESTSPGWNAPATAPWLEASLDRASRAHFGQPPAFSGVGGSIPFMSMLGGRFPDAQFVITGVLGPGSNAHGPNEFLDLPTARRVTACVAEVLADHYRRRPA